MKIVKIQELKETTTMIELREMYETKTFAELFDDYSDFKTEYTVTQKFPMVIGADDTSGVSNLQILYYLLYSKFGNSPIANYDENQFKTKLGAVIWQYGPAWEKRLDIQAAVRALGENPLDLSDIIEGSNAIHNHAYNPGEIGSETSTGTQTELTYINDQNVTKYNKSKMDAYGQLWSLIATDVTEEFLARFKPLFKTFVKPGTYLYESED